MFTPTPERPIFTIILLRHGESVGNANGYHQGQSNFPLTARGREQAQALAARWHADNTTFNQVISSPLARARETAEIIAANLGAPLTFDEDWMERDVGLLSGMRPEDAQREYPRPAFINIYQPIGETGESQWDIYLRAGRVVQNLLRLPAGRYLVVSHGGILNLVMYAILGIAPQANFSGPRFRFRNTAFATLTYTPHEHAWRVIGINDRQHWRGEDGD